MFEIILLMLAGMATGYLVRHRRKLLRRLETSILWSIYLLLFLLGISIGTNAGIMGQLADLGGQALVLSLAGTAGSILFAFLGWKFIFNKKGREQ